MKDSYRIKIDLDYKEAIYTVLYSIYQVKAIRGLIIFLLLLALMFAILAGGPIGMLLNIAALAAVMAIMLIILLIITYFNWKRNGRPVNKPEYSFTHWGMSILGGNTEFSTQWRNISVVKETSSFFIVFSGNDMFFVQKRMFSDETERAGFREFLKANNVRI